MVIKIKLWEKKSEAELREILENSSTYQEALIKIGYKGADTQNKEIKMIAQKYGIDIYHLGKKDLRGKQFGYLTVIDFDRDKDPNKKITYFLCRCKCGKIKSYSGAHLQAGDAVSCGDCSRRKDLTGMKFGQLTVLGRSFNHEKEKQLHRTLWRCQCSCGNIVEVAGNNLNRKNGGTQSCGCIFSKSEQKITSILEKNKYIFSKQFSFSDLKGDANRLLRFDFAIFDNNNQLQYLIEYNGQQHYENVDYWDSKMTLKKRQKYDKLKMDYCVQHKIPLYVIKFDEEITEDKICKL